MERSFAGYIKGGIALITDLALKSFVSQEEADRRSSICITCPHNVKPEGAHVMQWFDLIAKKAIGERRSINHNDLYNCECCTCPLRVKVHASAPFSHTKEQVDCMPDFCWVKQNIEK